MIKISILILILYSSCTSRHNSDAPKTVIGKQLNLHKNYFGDTLEIDLSKSIIYWKGTKMRGAGMHSGEIDLVNGFFLKNSNEIVGGEFTVDMNSIRITDIPPTDPVPIKNLTEHLKSAEFFDVGNSPFSHFVIVEANQLSGDSLHISGNLMIKEITRSVQIAGSMKNQSFTTTFLIDRFQWNIAYEGSWANRTLVDREMELRVELYFCN